MTRRIVVTPQAETQIRSIDAWWREHRPGATRLFATELAEVFAVLEITPSAGTPYRHANLKDIRRIPLKATRNHAYYVADEEVVTILAVWGAIKGEGPDLIGL